MSKRRLVALLLCLLFSLTALVGCGQEQKATDSQSDDNEAQQLPKITWRLQNAFSPPEKSIEGYDYMGGYGYAVTLANAVKERTNGNFVIENYAPNALVKTMEIPDAISHGAIEMACSNGAYHSSIVPEANLESGLPYGNKTIKENYDLIFGSDAKYFNLIRDAYKEKHNVYYLGLFSSGAQNFVSTFPINKVSDLKGKSVRATGIYGSIVKNLGGVPITLAPSEQYMGLQRKTMDATVYPAYCGISYKLFEVAPYHCWPGIFPSQNQSFLVNLDAWESLPKEYQDILQEEMDKITKLSFEYGGPGLDEISMTIGVEQYNSTATVLSDEEYSKFAEAVYPIWDEIADKSESCAELVRIAKEQLN